MSRALWQSPALTALSHCSSRANLRESYCSFQPRRTSGSVAPIRQHEKHKTPCEWGCHLVCSMHGTRCLPQGPCSRHLEPTPHVREYDLISTTSLVFQWSLIWGMLRLCTRSCSSPAGYWELACVSTLRMNTSIPPAWTSCPPLCRPESTFEHSAIW